MRQWALLNKPSFDCASQQVFIDTNGYIIESNDGIFNTVHLKNTEVKSWIPLLESLWEIVISDDVADNEEVIFERVHPQIPMLPGLYDFSFIKAEWSGQLLLVWSITEVMESYESLAKTQQLHNEKQLKTEQPTSIHRKN